MSRLAFACKIPEIAIGAMKNLPGAATKLLAQQRQLYTSAQAALHRSAVPEPLAIRHRPIIDIDVGRWLAKEQYA